MSWYNHGPRGWSMTRDQNGYREYKVKYLVETNDVSDGPFTAIFQAPGLPQVGDPWIIGSDSDSWAICLPNLTVTPGLTDEPNRTFIIEYTFSNKPISRCQDTQVENPILEPAKITGSFVKYQEEATIDRFGRPLLNSAREPIKGPKIEFDRNRPQISIDMNVGLFDSVLLAYSMVDKVNTTATWGLAPRCIKLSNVSFERKYWGLCEVYWSLRMDFDIQYETFDRILVDEGTKVLRGHWDQKSSSDTFQQWLTDSKVSGALPSDYIQFVDWNGNPSSVILDGKGRPAVKSGGSPLYMLNDDTQVATAGGGYVVGDILTITGGTFSTAGQLEVTEIDGIGGITRVEVVVRGSYQATTGSALPTNPVNVTGGTGSAAQFNVSWLTTPVGVSNVIIQDRGADYAVGNVILLNSGTYSDVAQLLVTQVNNFGGLLAVRILAIGSYTVIPINPVETIFQGAGLAGGGTVQAIFSNIITPADVGYIQVQKYDEAEFHLLNIPDPLG